MKRIILGLACVVVFNAVALNEEKPITVNNKTKEGLYLGIYYVPIIGAKNARLAGFGGGSKTPITPVLPHSQMQIVPPEKSLIEGKRFIVVSKYKDALTQLIDQVIWREKHNIVAQEFVNTDIYLVKDEKGAFKILKPYQWTKWDKAHPEQ